MNNNNEKPNIYDDNNIDFEKKAIEIELFSHACSFQYDCNPTIVKLKLFGNILFISNTINRVESSFVENNLSVV